MRNVFFIYAMLALAVYTSAFVCEALRSGINSVPARAGRGGPRGRADLRQTMREVILPQAFRAVLPPLASVLIAMIKNSAVAVGVRRHRGDRTHARTSPTTTPTTGS